MIRRFVLALTFVAVTFTFAFSETFNAKINKVDGDKVYFQKSTFDKDTKMVTYAAETSAVAIKGVEVTKGGGKGGAGKKGGGAPMPIDGGLTNDMFKTIDKEKGVNVSITTEDAGDNKGKIKSIAVKGGGKKGGG